MVKEINQVRLFSPYCEILLYLGKKKRLFEEVKTSTVEMSKHLKTSQQTISRKLIEMENLGLITKSTSQRGAFITLTQKSAELLRIIKDNLDSILNINMDFFSGKVVKGLGEGGYYVNLEGYQNQFIKKMGYKAFPGTLNVFADPLKVKQFLYGIDRIEINGFEMKERTFGGLSCFEAEAVKDDKTIKVHILVPERNTHPKEIVEIICERNLRKFLDLKENAGITIQKVR